MHTHTHARAHTRTHTHTQTHTHTHTHTHAEVRAAFLGAVDSFYEQDGLANDGGSSTTVILNSTMLYAPSEL
jgi:hypothetical protein